MGLDEFVRRLARHDLLAGFEPEALRLLAFSGETRIFRSGDVVFRAGETGDAAFLVTDGVFDVLGEDGGIRQSVSIDAMLGELALITDTPRRATIVAREPATALRLSRALFLRVLTEYPASATYARLAIARRLQAFTTALRSVPPPEEDARTPA